jgi:hypothetical protein
MEQQMTETVKTIRVVVIDPKQRTVTERQIEPTSQNLQQIVGGSIDRHRRLVWKAHTRGPRDFPQIAARCGAGTGSVPFADRELRAKSAVGPLRYSEPSPSLGDRTI